MSRTYEEQFDLLARFEEEEGTIPEFLEWLDSEEGQEWLDPMPENWLIRRDTLRKAGFAVMRRSISIGQEQAVKIIVCSRTLQQCEDLLEKLRDDPSWSRREAIAAINEVLEG